MGALAFASQEAGQLGTCRALADWCMLGLVPNIRTFCAVYPAPHHSTSSSWDMATTRENYYHALMCC